MLPVPNASDFLNTMATWTQPLWTEFWPYELLILGIFLFPLLFKGVLWAIGTGLDWFTDEVAIFDVAENFFRRRSSSMSHTVGSWLGSGTRTNRLQEVIRWNPKDHTRTRVVTSTGDTSTEGMRYADMSSRNKSRGFGRRYRVEDEE